MADATFYGEPLLTADASGTRVHSPFSFTKNVIIKAARFRVIVYNDPTLTSINGKIYSDDGSTAPNALIATSTDSRAKAELTSENNAVVETYVTFGNLSWKAGVVGHFVLGLSGYTGTTSSHIAFEKAYPDPVLPPTGHSYNKLLSNPYYMYLIFDEL